MSTVKQSIKAYFHLPKGGFFSSLLLVLTFCILIIALFSCEYLYRYMSGSDSNIFILPTKVICFLFLICPLYYGICLWFAEASKGNLHKFWEAFGFYTSPKLVIRCIFHTLIRFILLTLNLLPSIFFLLLSVFSFKFSVESADERIFLLSICLVIITLCLLSLGLISYTKYSLATYIFITSPEIGILKTFTASRRISKGNLSNIFSHKVRLNLLLFSFLFLFPIGICIKCIHLSKSYAKLCETDPPPELTNCAD